MSQHPEIDNSEIFEMLDKYDEANERKPFAWKTVLIVFGLVLVAIIGVAAFFNLAGGQLVISSETTFITEPLRSDGKTVDYFRAIELKTYPPEMKTDENGFRVIVRALGPDPFFESTDPDRWEKMREMCEKLDLPHPLIPTHTFHSIEHLFNSHSAANTQPGRDMFSIVLSQPWSYEDFPELEEWFEDMNPTLDLIAKELCKKTFCVPLTRKNEDETLIFLHYEMTQMSRSIARALAARANFRLGAGDIDGVIEDKIAIARLGRHMENQPFIVNVLVGLALEGISNNLAICNYPDVFPNREQIERLREELRKLPKHDSLMWQLEIERYYALDIIQVAGVMKKLDPDDLSGPFGRKSDISLDWVDWTRVMQRYNENFNNMLTSFANGTYIEEEIRPSGLGFLTTKGRSDRAGDMLSGVFMPAIYAFREAQRRPDCCENLQEITLAMLLYHEEHGCLPPACTVDDEGNALHSWRVLILPQLGHKELYDKINPNEPWDSEHNKQFHTEMPAVYQCPSNSTAKGITSYVVAVGDDLPFDGTGQGRKLSEFGPHSGDMILVSETKTSGENWMNPDFDVAYEDAADSVTGQYYGPPTNPKTFGSNHPGGFNAGKRNGAVGFISESLAKEKFDTMLKGTEFTPPATEQQQPTEDDADEKTESEDESEQEQQPRTQ